jgi:hypothetical protein
MCWGFACEDGWFGLIDAISETISEVDPQCQATQVKEKFGTLRFYYEGDHGDLDMAVGAAENYSSRVCEWTGAPGDLMKTKASYPHLATLCAKGVDVWRSRTGSVIDFQPVGESLRRYGSRPTNRKARQLPTAEERLKWSNRQAIAVLKKRHENALAVNCIIDIPRGGFDLADAVAAQISNVYYRGDGDTSREILKIARMLWTRDYGFLVEIEEASIAPVALAEMSRRVREWGDKPAVTEVEIGKLNSSLASVCLFARNMSFRIDTMTGCTGPVNDNGEQ